MYFVRIAPLLYLTHFLGRKACFREANLCLGRSLLHLPNLTSVDYHGKNKLIVGTTEGQLLLYDASGTYSFVLNFRLDQTWSHALFSPPFLIFQPKS